MVDSMNEDGRMLMNHIASWTFTPYYNIQKYNLYFRDFICCILRMVITLLQIERNAWMFYLNTVTDGGGTYWDNYDLTINAVKGRLVIWLFYTLS